VAALQLDHVNIHVHDLSGAREFLVGLLGVEVGWRPSFAVPGDWLYLHGRPVIHTWLKSQERGLGWVDHIAFGPCGDPDEKRAELQRLGCTFTGGRLIDTDITQFVVYGPEGLKIELQCRRENTVTG
jgi:catechol 2,3-dioxygenase-like lactoylglutathione lyase family enzyme